MNNLKEAITIHPFFCGMKPRHLDVLGEDAREMTFKPDETLFRVREPADRFLLIRSGKIALEAHEPADGTVSVQTLGPGEVVGWSWLFPPFVWNLQARALGSTEVIVLNGAHLLTTAERDHDFGYELMKRVAQVVIQRLQATRKLLLREQIASILEG